MKENVLVAVISPKSYLMNEDFDNKGEQFSKPIKFDPALGLYLVATVTLPVEWKTMVGGGRKAIIYHTEVTQYYLMTSTDTK